MMTAMDDYRPHYMAMAIEQALQAEREGSLPIGAIIVNSSGLVAAGRNGVMQPFFHPGRHAEMNALSVLEETHFQDTQGLHLYSTLEPCVMCLGSIVQHRIGKVFFGSFDPDGGAGYLLPKISERYAENYLPLWFGPTCPELTDELFVRAKALYRTKRPR
jgi:tRNA(adenine34) deaminase